MGTEKHEGKINFQPRSLPGSFQPSCDWSHWMSFRIFINELLLCLKKSQHKIIKNIS